MSHAPYDYTVSLAPADENAMCQCGACGYQCPMTDLDPIDNCALTPGDQSPAGRCPDKTDEDGEICGALCYVVKPDPNDAIAALNAVLCEEVHNLVVNGHTMDDSEKDAAQKAVLAKLPGIYEACRIAVSLSTEPHQFVAIRIGTRFVQLLKDKLTVTHFTEMVEANRIEDDPRICHSHDYLDANEVMAAAFYEVTGHDCDTTSDEHAAIWNAAWDFARNNGLRG